MAFGLGTSTEKKVKNATDEARRIPLPVLISAGIVLLGGIVTGGVCWWKKFRGTKDKNGKKFVHEKKVEIKATPGTKVHASVTPPPAFSG